MQPNVNHIFALILFAFIPSESLNTRDNHSFFTGRHDQHAIDLLKEYKDSISISRWYNASLVCQIPLFTLTLPQRGRTGEVRPSSIGYNLGLPMIQALFILAGIALFSPIIFPEERRRSLSDVTLDLRSLDHFLQQQIHLVQHSAIGRSLRDEERKSLFFFFGQHIRVAFDGVIQNVERLTASLPEFAKHKVDNCFRLSVCEIFAKHKKFGLLGFLFRAVFPREENSSQFVSQLRTAAELGQRKGKECINHFKCQMFSKWELILQLIRYLVDRSPDKLSETQRKVVVFLVDRLFSWIDNN